MKKNSRLSQYFVIACFLIFLVTAMLVTTLKPKEEISFYENRTLAEKPAVTVETLLNGEWGSANEAYLADHTAGRNTLLKLDTYLNVHVLKQPFVNQVVISGEYLLPEITDNMLDLSGIETDTKEAVQHIAEVRDVTESYGGRYCYVATPCQYVFHADKYPWYMNNRVEYTEKSVASLKKALEQRKITYVDMGEVFAKKNWDDRLTSKIDNHSSIYGAYDTYLAIMETLNTTYHLNLDVLTEGEYEITELPNPYLGSRVRELMGQWQSDEKLGVLYPTEKIPFTREDNWSIASDSVYALPENDEQEVMYSLYMGGDNAFTRLETHRPELPDVLVYGDSFTNAVECILYTGFDTMYAVDLRHYGNDFGELLKQLKPDVVICIRDYEALLSSEGNGRGTKAAEE